MEERHEYEKKIAVLEYQVKYWKTHALVYGCGMITLVLVILFFGLKTLYFQN